MNVQSPEDLLRLAQIGAISRRDVMKKALALGITGTSLSVILAACGGDDDDDSDGEESSDEPSSGSDDEDPTATDEGQSQPAATVDTAQLTADAEESEGEESEGNKGGSLVIAVGGDPQTLDPHVNSASSNTIYHHALFDHLIERSPDGTLYPGLATEWEVAEDSVTWTLKLREGVTFHDGTPFNAEAVVYNFERIVDPATKSEYAVFQLGPYESSRAIDEFTVELKMAEPYGLLPVSLATYGIAMVSPTAAEEAGDQFALNPVGSGPFMFKEQEVQSHVTFERNPDYDWASPIHNVQGVAPLEEVTFRTIPEAATRTAALLSGEVDMADIAGPDFGTFDDDPDFTTQKVLTEGYPPAGVFINVTKPPTDDVLVRKALAFGVDRQEVNLVVYEGNAADADNVVSTFSWAYDPEAALYNFDPEQAAALLDEAGWMMGDGDYREKDGEELKIVHLALTGVKAVAEVVQAQLKNIGVNVELLVQDNPAQQQSGQEGVHNLVWTQWSGVDPGDLWKIYRSSEIGSGWNFCHYNNPDVDALFDEGAAENDPEIRKEIYSELQMTLMDDATFIPLNNRTVFFAMKNKVKGTDVIDERGSWGRLYDFYLEEE